MKNVSKALGYASLIAGSFLLNPDSAQAQKGKYDIFADEWKSSEVLVNWDKEKDRSYIGTGLPLMNAQDTLKIPKHLKGDYNVHIYNSPKGVKLENNSFISSEYAESGVINALVYKKDSKGEITESTRLLVPVFNGKNKTKISELEKMVETLEEDLKKEMLRGDEYLTKLERIQESEKKESEIKKAGEREREKYFPKGEIIAGGLVGNLGLAGGDIGFGYGFKKGSIRLLANYSGMKDKKVNEVSVALGRGREGRGNEKEINQRSYGIALEISPYINLSKNIGAFLGAGINSWNYTTRVEEEIVSGNGDILKTNTISKSDSDLSRRIYGGFEIPVLKNIHARIGLGNDSRSGWYGRGGVKIKLGNKHHKTHHRK